MSIINIATPKPAVDGRVGPHIPDLIADQLAIAHADCRATLAAIPWRTAGMKGDDLLLAAIALLRDQAARISDLENEASFLTDEKERAERELTALVTDIKNLLPERLET